MSDKYISPNQQRVLSTLKALFGHEFTGVATTTLANQLGYSTDRVFKDLKNLEESGLAEQLPDKNWRIAPLLGREAVKVMHTLEATRRRLDETVSRYGIGN